MKAITTILAILTLTITYAQKPMKSLHDFTMKTIDGKDLSLTTFKGKKVMVVNTASECGLTPQYKLLEELYLEFKDKNLVILGFPANNFGGQEPGSDAEIQTFCTKNYGVTFPMFSKISVKGNDMHPLYKFLTSFSENGAVDAPVTWNFQKFLIDENGHVVDFVTPTESPASDKVLDWLKK
ncbi:MAG: glutathione peroxidase [Sphingobacteriales bacterium JAD_PAG50586_3]|nr:MAG: glutathione peroxidase [Sphingobacteriales bacterium JAD_PAG50586_3]